MRARWLAAALLLAAGVRLGLDVRAVLSSGREAVCREESDFHSERGEALIHGVPLPGVARAMPFYSVSNAFLCGHGGRSAPQFARAAALLVGAFLVFALGTAVFSFLRGALAAALYSFLPAAAAPDERWLYAPVVLLAAFFLVRREQERSRAADAALGAALGAGFLVLSPLFLFPVLLWVVEARRTPRRAGAARSALIAYLFLAPWLFLNLRLSGRPVLFEDGRADNNIVMGALGRVHSGTMGAGDYRALTGAAPGKSLLVWAAVEALRHPARSAYAIAARLAAVAWFHPILFLAAVLSLAWARRRGDVLALAGLAACYAVSHCLMPVQESYLTPLWPLACVLAAGIGVPGPDSGERALRSRLTLAAGVLLALLLAAEAWTQALVLLYPSRASRPDTLDRELARSPGDAWLWSRRGMERLFAGRPSEAAEDFARAQALDPGRDRALRLAWARLAQGAPEARVLENLDPGTDGLMMSVRARVLRAVRLALDDGHPGAFEELAAARELELSRGAVTSAVPRLLSEVLSTLAQPRRARAAGLLLDSPQLERLPPEGRPELLLTLSAALAADGRRAEALRGLRLASGLALDEDSARSLATAYRDLGRYDEALAALQRVSSRRRDDEVRFLDLALAAARAGRSAAARAALAEAGEASGRFDLERAEVLSALGDREAASLVISRTRPRVSGGEDLRRLARVEQDAGLYARALADADRGVAALPRDARWRSDRGVLRALTGDRRGARADFEAALALDPELSDARASLKALDASEGRRERAGGAELPRP